MATTAIRRRVIALGSVLFVLIAVLATLNNNLRFLNPSTTEEIFVFTGLSAVVFLVFVAVLVMLVRTVLKLYADQKSRVMGSRLRTRMLWGAVLVSLLPISFMSLFNFVLMNRAVDHWFAKPVMEMRDDSDEMALELSRYTTANARAEADSIAASLGSAFPEKLGVDRLTPKEHTAIGSVLQQHQITLQGGFAMVLRNGRAIDAYQMPHRKGQTAEVRQWIDTGHNSRLAESPEDAEPGRATDAPSAADQNNAADAIDATDTAILATAQRTDQPVFTLDKIDYALGTAGVKQGVTVVVGLPMPHGMAATMTRLRADADTYFTLFRGRRQIRTVYMQLLLMITSLTLFASCWLALHLSKQVTRPVEALADAMDQIAAGDYAHRVQESATEELGDLVHSFNRMVGDLESSRAQVEQSTIQISQANATLEARRNELETMLETIPNGVATLDANRCIVLANRALSEMMDPGGQRPFLGVAMEEVFPEEVAEVLDRLIRRSHRMGSASSEFEMTAPSQGHSSSPLNLLATVALLENVSGSERTVRGYVIVLENATELLQAQKQSAWKEVARRVAHEIKNPLTPISLSAEQIHRHISRLSDTLAEHSIDSPSPAVIRRCSEVITSSVESMRSLVDQFSALAEFPTSKPRPADLNTIVENTLAIFAGRMTNIRLISRMGRNLPLVFADPEALKRALGNLIDNAAEAMQASLLRELRVSTTLLDSGLVELTIADTGTGLTDDMRERLFLPYFSTKQRGTGLGLAIAAKIIQEHQGSIRAEKNLPAGAKFIVELRPASVGEMMPGELPPEPPMLTEDSVVMNAGD
jgi:nitrogen fixation/metabolism regulation signal transduction histidine kinase